MENKIIISDIPISTNSNSINKPTITSKLEKQTKQTKTDSFTVEELHKYYNEFMSNYKDISCLIESALSDENNNDKTKIEKILSEINIKYESLQNNFKDNSMYLVSYDKDNYLKCFEEIHQSILSIKEKLNPKKKFKFSNRKAETSINKKDTSISNIIDNIDITTNTKTIYSEQDLVISNQLNKTIIINEEETKNKVNILLENLSNIKLYIPFSLKSLFAKKLDNCFIFIAGVQGGSHLTEINNSECFISTHQLRIHESINTLFSIIVSSKPIIEKCSGLSFGNLINHISDKDKIKLGVILNINYNDVNSSNNSGTTSHFSFDNNYFYDVQDFQWLKTEKSPNFIIIKEDEDIKKIGIRDLFVN